MSTLTCNKVKDIVINGNSLEENRSGNKKGIKIIVSEYSRDGESRTDRSLIASTERSNLRIQPISQTVDETISRIKSAKVWK